LQVSAIHKEKMSDAHLSLLRFDSLNIPDSVKRGIAELGYTRCTPIQAQTLPVALEGRDVAGQAQTGTGKTAAFLIALFNRLLTDPGAPNRPQNAPRAIVIAPTRELAVQIHSDAEGIGKYTGLKLAIVFGGVDYEKQRRVLEEGVDVLIGTPGRIIDYFKQHVFDLRHIQVAVMDEADRMFDLGFIKDIRFLLRRLPHPTLRLTMMFSATLSHRVMELAYEHMNNPELIRIEPDKMTVDRVTQVLYFPSTEEKIPLLMGLLRRIDARRTMVFVNTKRIAEVLERTLTANGFVAQALSGDVPQTKRLKMMRDFHNGDIAVLIATDVASRGLHIPDVSHVFNFDLPNDAEDYVHRIGRTARAGAEGDAISFGCEEYAISLPDIERYIGHQIPRAAIEAVDLAVVTAPPPAEWRERAPRHGQSRGSSGGGGRSAGSGGGRSGGYGGRSGSGGSSSSNRSGAPRRGSPPGSRTSHGTPAHGSASHGPAQSTSGSQQNGQHSAPQGPRPTAESGRTSAGEQSAPPGQGDPTRRRRRRGRGGGGPTGGSPAPGAAGPAAP
jgi:ATP-dependent RNA helicase RhlB